VRPLASAKAITFRIDADNATDKRYWSMGGTLLYVDLSRSVRASATIDF
jgi:iron complex outermembrane receptor protein